LGKAVGKGRRKETFRARGVRIVSRKSSISEKPIGHSPRRLAGWLNPEGAKKVHSLVDKVYKRQNLEIAWIRVKKKKGCG
jgi:hypothetical protein